MDSVNGAFFDAGRRMTPVSDHLLDVMRHAISDIVPEPDVYEELFDEAEYLMGIAFAAHSRNGRSPPTRAVWRYYEADGFAGTFVRRHAKVLVAADVFSELDHLTQTCDDYEEFQRQLYGRLRYRS